MRVAVTCPQLQAPCGSDPNIMPGGSFSEGRRIIFIPSSVEGACTWGPKLSAREVCIWWMVTPFSVLMSKTLP